MFSRQSKRRISFNHLPTSSLFLLLTILVLLPGQTSTTTIVEQNRSKGAEQQIQLPQGGGITSIHTRNEKMVIERGGVIHLEKPVDLLNRVTITGTDDEDDIFCIEVSKKLCDTLLVEGGKGGFDVLEIIGTEGGSVIYNFYNNHDGNVEFDFNEDTHTDLVIEYTGLEPISSTMTEANVILNYSSSTETITITNPEIGKTQVDSDVAESVSFTNPTSSLTINGGDGDDNIVVSSFSTSFNADFTVDGEGGSNTFTCNSSVNVGSGNITIYCDNFSIGGNIQSTGMLFIFPSASGTSIGIGGGSGTLNFTDTELAYLVDGFADIVIGDGSSGDMDINTATFTDPISLNAGGAIHDGSGTDITAPSIGVFGDTAPGQSPGILTASGNFTFAEGSSFSVEFGGASPGSATNNHDQLSVSGSVTISNNIMLNTSSVNGYTPSGNEQYTVINNDGTSDAVSGTFSGLAEGATVSSNFLSSGLGATISYVSGDGNDVVITVNNPVPVELTSFSAMLFENKINLSWSTATEVDNYGFSVERKMESRNWEEVGFVEGHGNSNSPKNYQFIDTKFNQGVYYYRLKQIDTDGAFEHSDFVKVTVSEPTKFELNQNYPNPFNPTTEIEFSIPENGYVTLKIFNSIGEQVETLIDKHMRAGRYKHKFNGENLPSGIYMYKLQAGTTSLSGDKAGLVSEFSLTKKMLLIK